MSRSNVKKNKKKKINFVVFLVLNVFIILLVFISCYGYKSFKNMNNDKDIIKDDVVEKKEEDKIYKISMIMAGDNLIHSSLYKEAYRNGGGTSYDFKPMYDLIKPIVKEYDIAYYNQETILGGSEIGLSDYPTFNSPYEAGDAMIDAGFNLVSLASNHTVDKGRNAVINSRKYWDSKSDVLAVGSYSNMEERDKIDIRESNNISYTLLNYTYGTNGMPVSDEYLVNVWPVSGDINNPSIDTEYQKYKEKVKEDIERVRDKVDVLMVAMHWGVEYVIEPTIYEKDMASYLASLDVDVIIGTHPHIIQPITWIDDTLVIYSLGNLISAQYQDEWSCYDYRCVVGLLSSIDITKTVSDGKTSIKIDNLNNELVYTYYNRYTWRDFKVIPFSNSEISSHLNNYKKVYDTYSDIVRLYDSNIKINSVYEG